MSHKHIKVELADELKIQAMNLFCTFLPIFSQIASILGSSAVFIADYVSDSVSKQLGRFLLYLKNTWSIQSDILFEIRLPANLRINLTI